MAWLLPCQGFTSLTSKWRRDDSRNELVMEMARVILEIMPTVVMMENVPRLVSRGRELMDSFITALEGAGYHVTYDVLQVADYGTPQVRKRLVLLAGRGFSLLLPEATHSREGRGALSRWRTVRETIEGFTRPPDFVDVRASMGTLAADWHVVRRLSPANLKRMRRARPGHTWRAIPEKLRPHCHRNGYVGFGNVYGRMAWDDAAPTITSGCVTFSKGRFGHPEQDRTISVREAALLQEFPDDYRIETRHIDQATSIIGNALPCGFATAMASQAATCIAARRRARRPKRPSRSK